MTSVGSQNLDRNFDFFYKNYLLSTGESPNAWRTFCQILVALDQFEPPLKALIMLQNIVSMKDTIILVLVWSRYDVSP